MICEQQEFIILAIWSLVSQKSKCWQVQHPVKGRTFPSDRAEGVEGFRKDRGSRDALSQFPPALRATHSQGTPFTSVTTSSSTSLLPCHCTGDLVSASNVTFSRPTHIFCLSPLHPSGRRVFYHGCAVLAHSSTGGRSDCLQSLAVGMRLPWTFRDEFLREGVSVSWVDTLEGWDCFVF